MPKVYRVELSEGQREELHRRTRDPKLKPRTRDRLEMVRLSDAGFTIPRIAQITRVSEHRVRYWIKRFLDGGFDALPDVPHVGPSSAVTPEIVAAVKEELRKQERTWTARHLAEWLAEVHGVRRTPGHLARRFQSEGIVWKRTRRSLAHKQDPVDVAAKRAELEDLEKRGTQA